MLTEICRWLIDTTVATSALLVGTLVAMRFLRQPAHRQRLGELALVGCLAMAAAHAIPGVPRISLAWFEANPRAMLSDGFYEDAIGAVKPADVSKTQAGAAGAHAASNVSAAPVAPVWEYARYWREGLAALYLVILLAGAVRFSLAHLRLRKIVRNATAPSRELATLHVWLLRRACITPPLLVSDEIDRPLTFGVRHPVVVLPRALATDGTAEELSAVLRHELTHVSRGDARTWLLVAWAGMMLGPNPLLRLLTRQLRLAQEFIADHAAADATDPAEYAQTILQLVQGARARPIPLTAAAWMSRSDLYLRMRRLLTAGVKTERFCRRGWTLCAALAILLASSAIAAVSLSGTTPEAQLRATERRGAIFLLTQQEPTGGWLTRFGPAPTALTVRALLQSGVAKDHPAIVRALDYVDSVRQSDGGYYTDSEPTYHTAIVLAMYAAIDTPEAHARIEAGRVFLQRAAESTSARPGAWYATRQNSTSLQSTFADPKERTADAVLDTYGALTYAKWKSLLYAGLASNDARVVVGTRWLESHWTLDKHPGTGSAEGLYYYYLAAARTLRASGKESVAPEQHGAVDWRTELQRRLAGAQRSDGSWLNSASPRWLEDQPTLVTAYAMLTLQETRR